jgi:ABC-type phosphate transport system substrate-binding protein
MDVYTQIRNSRRGLFMVKKLGLTTLLALVLVAVAASTAGARHQGTTISGAGSTFVQPLVSQWIAPLGSA